MGTGSRTDQLSGTFNDNQIRTRRSERSSNTDPSVIQGRLALLFRELFMSGVRHASLVVGLHSLHFFPVELDGLEE